MWRIKFTKAATRRSSRSAPAKTSGIAIRNANMAAITAELPEPEVAQSPLEFAPSNLTPRLEAGLSACPSCRESVKG